MFGFITRFFTRRVKSLDDFISIVKTSGSRQVVIEPYMANKGMAATTATVGRIGYIGYFAEITAKVPRGRKVVFKNTVTTQFGSAYGIADRPDRQKSAIRMYLVGEKMADEIKKRLPDVSVELIGPDERPMDNNKFAQLHRDAAAAGVTI